MSNIQVNPKSKKIMPLFFLFCVLLFLFLFVAFILQVRQSRGYAKVNAIVMGVQKKSPMSGSRAMEFSNYVTYSFEYEGKEYVTERMELTLFGKKTGKQVSIKCSVENPYVIENVYIKTITAVGAIICLIASVLLFIMMKQ